MQHALNTELQTMLQAEDLGVRLEIVRGLPRVGAWMDRVEAAT